MPSKRRNGEVPGEGGPEEAGPGEARALPWLTLQPLSDEPFGEHMRIRNRSEKPEKPRFTPLQGQYLAFIHAYSLVNGRPPAETDLQRHFQVSPPVVHEKILALERKGLLERVPWQARSIRVLVAPEDLPILREPPSKPAPSHGIEEADPA